MELHLLVSLRVQGRKKCNFYADISQGVFFFFGCMLMILGAVGEWIVGNTFPCVVFGTFGEYTRLIGGQRTKPRANVHIQVPSGVPLAQPLYRGITPTELMSLTQQSPQAT